MTLLPLSTVRRQPHVVFPLLLQQGSIETQDEGRRLQQQGDQLLHVELETHATSSLEASSAEQRLIHRLAEVPAGRRRMQSADLLHDRQQQQVCGLEEMEPEYCTSVGQVAHRSAIDVGYHEVEQLASLVFATSPDAQHAMQSCPTIEEMLQTGSAANGFLASLFVKEQKPLETQPVAFLNADDVGGRRSLQTQGDELHVLMEARAATVSDCLLYTSDAADE